MKLVFLGTRGYIEARSRRHRRHTATLVVYRGRRVLIDCGEDWRGRPAAVRPHAIALTHAHPDHALGLDQGAPCPVYASEETWTALGDYPIEREKRRTLRPRRPSGIAGIRFEAFPVMHSVRAPAVGFRIQAGRVAVFYVPDVIAIPDRAEAFAGIRLYVGDGACVTRPLVRRDRSGALVGHTTIRAQLGWCAVEGVPRMIITHCGTPIVAGDERTLGPVIRRLGRAIAASRSTWPTTARCSCCARALRAGRPGMVRDRTQVVRRRCLVGSAPAGSRRHGAWPRRRSR